MNTRGYIEVTTVDVYKTGPSPLTKVLLPIGSFMVSELEGGKARIIVLAAPDEPINTLESYHDLHYAVACAVGVAPSAPKGKAIIPAPPDA